MLGTVLLCCRAWVLYGRKVISLAENDTAKSTRNVALADFNIRTKAFEDTVPRTPFDRICAAPLNLEFSRGKAPLQAVVDIAVSRMRPVAIMGGGPPFTTVLPLVVVLVPCCAFPHLKLTARPQQMPGNNQPSRWLTAQPLPPAPETEPA